MIKVTDRRFKLPLSLFGLLTFYLLFYLFLFFSLCVCVQFWTLSVALSNNILQKKTQCISICSICGKWRISVDDKCIFMGLQAGFLSFLLATRNGFGLFVKADWQRTNWLCLWWRDDRNRGLYMKDSSDIYEAWKVLMEIRSNILYWTHIYSSACGACVTSLYPSLFFCCL